MKKFETFTGIVAAFDRPNIDTDAIIPKQYLKSIKRSGYGPTLFDDWRYLDPGEPGQDHSQRRLNPDFVLNQVPYNEAQIILARENFGCGSSREHAVWALDDFGIRVVVAPSFANIFFNNSFKNGLLPITLPEADIDQLFHAAQPQSLTVDLESQQITTTQGRVYDFEIEEFRRYRLLNGLDDIGLTLQQADAIKGYEVRRAKREPWIFT